MGVVDLRNLALKKVKIDGNIIGKFGTFEIEQIYKNDTEDILEVEYTFPIVETATVVGFEINVGDKKLVGKCKEKEEAKREYQKNIVEGNSAYMMQQETDNIFKISVGKIDRNEEVKIVIKYIDKFDILDNTIMVMIPTLVTPKYKSNITDNLEYGKVDYTVDFSIKIDKALKRRSISCTSHEVNIIDEETTERIEVLDYDLSKDFKLNIQLKEEKQSNAIKTKTRDKNDLVYLSFMPEILDLYEDSEKEYIFIIDISGSMSGKKIEKTKKAVIESLKQLDIGDKFNIIPFESKYEAMSINSVEYNEENLKRAIEYVNKLVAYGGTEILNPLKFALYEKDVDKTILLFTDGQVGNENEIIEYIENNINTSRLFPFGIDMNVNTAFIKRLAKVGNGKAELIQNNERIDDIIIRTFARIQTPIMEKIEIDYGLNKVIEEIKEENCLFNYEFFNVFAKVEKLEDDIKLKGKILDKEYIFTISKNEIKNTDVDLETLFAKQKMEQIEECIKDVRDQNKKDNYKKMIIELSEKYNINSKYTAFLTVYERENKVLEIPKYQKTVLSNQFVPFASIASARKLSRGRPRMSKDGNMANVNENNKIVNQAIEDRRKIQEKVEEYYNHFIPDKETIKTYLLYAIYYLKNRQDDFNFNYFLGFLNKYREVIQSNEIYEQLMYKCYMSLGNNESEKKQELLELFSEKYKKMILTNVKIHFDVGKIITDSDIREIVKADKIIENIDDVLSYLSVDVIFDIFNTIRY